MEIKWEKLPERLHSESLKCLLCNVMKKYARNAQGVLEGFAHCCVYMTQALVTDDDEAFTKDGETLMKSLDVWLGKRAEGESRAEVGSFLDKHHEYIRDRVKEVLCRATKCPEFKTKH